MGLRTNWTARLYSRIIVLAYFLAFAVGRIPRATLRTRVVPSCARGPSTDVKASQGASPDTSMSGHYRRDGVRIQHDPYAPGMAEKYGRPGETDDEGFDPYAGQPSACIW